MPLVRRALAPTPGSVGAQPLDADLTTIAGLTSTTDNFLQSKSSAWASRTPTQVAADLVTPLSTSLQPRSPDRLTTGHELFSRMDLNSNVIGTTNQILRLSFFTADWTGTTTQVRLWTGSTAAAATPTLIVLALFTVDGAGDGTQVAVTTNDTTLLAATGTAYTKDWATPYVWVPGQRYAWGHLVVTGAAAPTLCGFQAAAGSPATAMAAAPRLCGQISGQATMPTSFTEAGLTNNGNRSYAVFL